MLLRSRNEVNNAIGDDAVGNSRPKGLHVSDARLNKRDIGFARFTLNFVGFCKHILLHVSELGSKDMSEKSGNQCLVHINADDFSRRPDSAGSKESIKTSSASEIDYRLALEPKIQYKHPVLKALWM